MPEIKFYNREPVPMEMHKVKIVQKLTLLPVKERLKKLQEPKTLRFFTGKLEPVSDWPQKLMEAYIKDFGEEQ